ncbi:hypothetical protein CDV55_106160 [Aspergillus turcosus]|uniref:Uncharacterized protein n=1 Tax=Aspergillus turcosus TaxID=1245748 RepID=A0A229X991_9EURO|nr:hypothetical protein CDV55_106160 [Aspergillus turcosus]RLL97850.1 hypothetical protein CFD26_103298 [Aspergillus turcosus]
MQVSDSTFHSQATRTWLSRARQAATWSSRHRLYWMGSSAKHITTYTHLHCSIAPHARIPLIETEVPILVSSYARQLRVIRAALDVVLETLAEYGNRRSSCPAVNVLANRRYIRSRRNMVIYVDMPSQDVEVCGILAGDNVISTPKEHQDRPCYTNSLPQGMLVMAPISAMHGRPGTTDLDHFNAVGDNINLEHDAPNPGPYSVSREKTLHRRPYRAAYR